MAIEKVLVLERGCLGHFLWLPKLSMLMNVSGSKLSAMVVKLAISPRHELVVVEAWRNKMTKTESRPPSNWLSKKCKGLKN